MKYTIIQDVSELSSIQIEEDMFLDFETTSGDDTKKSTNPWKHCKVLGVAVLFGRQDKAYYIPVRHRGDYQVLRNLPAVNVGEWLKVVFSKIKRWYNHNIKYDMHVIENEWGIDPTTVEIHDTLTKSKLAPKVERFDYNLGDLSKDWLYKDISHLETKVKMFVKKDYGTCPIDYMAEYACTDVITVRDLNDMLDLPDNMVSPEVWAIEQQLTQYLYKMERRGVRLDMPKLYTDFVLKPTELALLNAELAAMTGIAGFRGHSNADCQEYFINRKNLPVMLWTNEDDEDEDAVHNPSFTEESIKMYKGLVPDELIAKLLHYREEYKRFTSFTEPFIELNVNGRLHTFYNQAVRTGRLSSKEPNLQQLDEVTKRYILAEEGRCLVDFDYSQIEYRMIAHYTGEEKVIQAYQKDPKTDYHRFITSSMGLNPEDQKDRSLGKTLNFLLGYGGGKKKATKQLIKVLGNFDGAAEQAESLFEKYHENLPTLRQTMREAAKTVRSRGYIKTLMGRRRYFPKFYIDKKGRKHDPSYKGFNTACQGSAADFAKAATLRLVRKHTDINLLAVVHDSWLIDAPIGFDTEPVSQTLSELPCPFKVPIICKATIYERCWGE